MKLTYIANARFPTEKAHGLQVAKTIGALMGWGVIVQLVVPLRIIAEKFKLPNAKSFYDLDRDLEPIRLPCVDLMFLAPIEKSVDLFLFALESLTFMLSVTLYGLLKRKEPLYTRDPYMFFLLSFLRKNLFLELHTYPSTKFGKRLLKIVMHSAEGIVVTNRYLQNKVEEQGIMTEKIRIIPNGADLKLRKRMISKTLARKKLDLSASENIVLYLGNFCRSKGVYELCQAEKYLPKNTKVLLVGGSRVDRNIQPLKEFINNNKIKNVHIVEYKNRSKVATYLSAADVCVLPNIITDEESEYFTTPLKMFDYMVAKRPIVASDLPALRQILDEKTAVFVRPNDPKELASAILHTLRNSEEAKKRVEAAYAVANELSWRNRAKVVKTFIKQKLIHD